MGTPASIPSAGTEAIESLGSDLDPYDRHELIGEGKLQSTDGVYGFRFTHNVEAITTGFSVTPR